MTATLNASTANGVILTSDTSGNLDIQSNGTSKVSVTSGVTTIASLTATTYTPATSLITSGTAQASTSGTSIDFTGIPSWVKRISIMLNAVSTSGASNMIVQLGTSGGVTTTGYNGAGSFISTAVGTLNSSTGFMIQYGTAASNLINGIVLIANISGNQWVESATLGRSDSAGTHTSGGVVSLSGALTTVRLTTVNGTDTFDAGSINILYE
jgi:hypothetical protein